MSSVPRVPEEATDDSIAWQRVYFRSWASLCIQPEIDLATSDIPRLFTEMAMSLISDARRSGMGAGTLNRSRLPDCFGEYRFPSAASRSPGYTIMGDMRPSVDIP